MDRKNRLLNIEALRIMMMLFIIMWHIVINNIGLQNTLKNNINAQESIFWCYVGSIIVIGVNVFFLISGYFGLKLDLKKILKIILNLYLYSFLLTIAATMIENENDFSKIIINLLCPFKIYWFVYVYILLIIFSPILNAGSEKINEMTECNIKIYVFILTFIVCIMGMFSGILGINYGYSVGFGMYAYIIGRVLHEKKLWFNYTWRKCGGIFIGLAVLNGTLMFLFINVGYSKLAWLMLSYNNPVILIMSICMFKMFTNMNIDSQLEKYRWGILWLSKYILPIYYIHTRSFFSVLREVPIEIMTSRGYENTIMLIAILIQAAFIYFICSIIGMCMSLIFSRIESKLISSMITK